MPIHNNYKKINLKKWGRVFPVIDITDRLKKNKMYDKSFELLRLFKNYL